MALLRIQNSCGVDGQFTRVGITGRGNLARKKAPYVFTVKLAVRHTTLGGSQSATCDHSIIRVYSAWASRFTAINRNYEYI